MPGEVVLYDLPSKDIDGKCRCWSFNTWKVRLTLNFKRIPYRTEWIEYPDIKPRFQSFGIPPTPAGNYGVPTIRLPDGTYLMGTPNIVSELEKLQPEPTLFLDSGYDGKAYEAARGVLEALEPIGLPRVYANVLRPASRDHFLETREKEWGMSLPELAKSDKAGENAWKAAHEPMEKLNALLHENGDGPYIMGKQPSFADFILAGIWRFAEVLDEDGDYFGRWMQVDESFPKHYEACWSWMQRDD